MRAAVSAAALVMALVASSSAQAAMKKFTFTENDANGQTYTGSFMVDNQAQILNGGFGVSANTFAVSNFTGIFSLPATIYNADASGNSGVNNAVVTIDSPFFYRFACQSHSYSGPFHAGTNVNEYGAAVLTNNTGLYSGSDWVSGTYNLIPSFFGLGGVDKLAGPQAD
jgi:hypothetical protein